MILKNLIRQNPKAFAQAYIHRSSASSYSESNERLEFLGDSILGAVLSDALFSRFPNANEGTLSKIRAFLVNANTLSEISQGLFDEKDIKVSGTPLTVSIKSSFFEAILGCCFRVFGFDQTRDVILEIFNPYLDEINQSEVLGFDPKSELQIITQRLFSSLPVYEFVNASGPDHSKVFEYRVVIGNRVLGVGTGHSKQESQKSAARSAILALSTVSEKSEASL